MKRLVVRVIAIALFGFLSWTGLFALKTPVFAAPQAQSNAEEAVISPDGETYSNREDAYESALEAANDPNGLEKAYQKDLKIFKDEHPDKADLVDSGIVEGAKEAIEKVTGK